jgi:hypothetical protein
MEISIKKPCHESWDEMTPNEQGAFCGKCVKTVIDFSTKSLDEINRFFAGREQQKICGRFEETQLTALSFDAFFDKFKRFEFNKRFTVILFFTFGFWLFGASGAIAQNNVHTKGDVQVEQPVMGQTLVDPTKKDTAKCIKPNTNNIKIMGKVAPVKPPTPVKPTPKKPPMKMGTVAAPPPKKTDIPKK